MKPLYVPSVVALGAALALSASCRAGREATPPARPNILLVTIDTLRADRLRPDVMPEISKLAEAGVRFDNARATVPLTLPSHVTIMTGMLPPEHGVRDNGVVFTPRAERPTLAAALRGAGYRTGAFVGAYVLDRRFGLADGFETYDDRIRRNPDLGARLEAERPGAEVVDAAVAWLKQTAASSPFFLWVHLYDPHAPYEPPAGAARGAVATPYDAEVAYADAQVGRVLAALGGSRVVVAVLGDHGEGLGEHGEQTHGMLAYETTLRVPLVIAALGPDRAAALSPRAVGAPVSLADVAPTLRRLVGVPEGRPDLLGALARERDVYAETLYPRAAGWHTLSVLTGERWKLIRSSEAELYDLSVDPSEQHDVAGSNAAIVQGMTSRLTQLQTESAGAPAAQSPADAAERLRALGYVSGAPIAAAKNSRTPNPARVIDRWTAFEIALTQINAGRSVDALPALKGLASAYPDAPVFQTTYGRALKETGRAADAVAVYRRAVARVQDANLFHDLAVAAREAGLPAEALKAEQAALALGASNPDALNGLGLLHADSGRPKDAADAFERAAALDPSNASFWANLGNARRELSEFAAAEAAYKRALEIDPTYADAANGLGVLLVQRGRPADAIPWFERAAQQAPDFYEARLNLGIALQESGQRDKATAVYRDILARAPARFTRERSAARDLLRQLGVRP